MKRIVIISLVLLLASCRKHRSKKQEAEPLLQQKQEAPMQTGGPGSTPPQYDKLLPQQGDLPAQDGAIPPQPQMQMQEMEGPSVSGIPRPPSSLPFLYEETDVVDQQDHKHKITELVEFTNNRRCSKSFPCTLPNQCLMGLAIPDVQFSGSNSDDQGICITIDELRQTLKMHIDSVNVQTQAYTQPHKRMHHKKKSKKSRRSRN